MAAQYGGKVEKITVGTKFKGAIMDKANTGIFSFL